MIISTPYLPETTANVRHQYVPSTSVCAGQLNSSVTTDSVREWFLIIASSQVPRSLRSTSSRRADAIEGDGADVPVQ